MERGMVIQETQAQLDFRSYTSLIHLQKSEILHTSASHCEHLCQRDLPSLRLRSRKPLAEGPRQDEIGEKRRMNGMALRGTISIILRK